MAWWDCGETIAAGSGGCLGAWQAVGAVSKAASYVNIADPGTNDLTPINPPEWSPVSGWFHRNQTNIFHLNTGLAMTEGRSVIIRVANFGAQKYTARYFGADPGYTTSGPRMMLYRYMTGLSGQAGSNTGAATEVTIGTVQNSRGVDFTLGFSGSGRYFVNGAFARAAKNYITPFTTAACFIGTTNPRSDTGDCWTVACAMYDKILSDEEHATIGAAIAALPWADDEVPAHTTPRIIYVSGV